MEALVRDPSVLEIPTMFRIFPLYLLYSFKQKWSMMLVRLKQFFQQFLSNEGTSGHVRRGTLRYFNRSRGYGFIKPDGPENRIFVHVSDMEDRLRVGDEVQFKVEDNEKGPKAIEVELA